MATKQPTCRSCHVELPEDATHFPFCSERCKNQDLHGWFTEKYKVKAEPAEEVVSIPTAESEND